MADIVYNSFKKHLMSGNIAPLTDTLKCMLVTSSYTPDQDAHEYADDVTNEVTGTGYTAGGATLASKTITQDNDNDVVVFDFADPAWTDSSITARGAVIYKDTGTPSTSPLIAYLDFITDRQTIGVDFNIRINESGFIEL